MATCLHRTGGRRASHSMKILHVLHNSLPLLCGYSIRSGYIVNLQRAMGLETAVVSSGQHPNGEQMREAIDGVEYPAHSCSTGVRAISARGHVDAQPRAPG